jgi:peptidase E
VPTASGDAAANVAEFYRAFGAADCSDLTLFDRRVSDIRKHLLAQDVIYVGGGNTASLLAVWRAHGVDDVMREAYSAGVLLSGVSAGMNCWFEASVTDSFDRSRLAPLNDGLGLLPGSACPHWDGEEQRRPTYLELIASGFPAGYAADDCAALRFRDGSLVEAVAVKEGARAFRVELVDGEAVERELPVRLLATGDELVPRP